MTDHPYSKLLLFAACLLMLTNGLPTQAQFGGGRYPFPIGPPHVVILILADDVGQDVMGVYDLGGTCSAGANFCRSDGDCATGETCETDYAITPTIDALAASGIVFHNAWSNPVCSPTRATIQTGRYGFRTGIGTITKRHSINSLSLNELAIPEVLDNLPAPVQYDVPHAAIGKWHLTSFATGSEDHPRQLGYSHYAGSMFNLNGESFFEWTKHVNGTALPDKVTNYATTDNVDDALAWIDAVTPDGSPGNRLPLIGYQPLFLYLPFNAAHSPWEAPPDALLSAATVSRLQALGLSAGDSCAGGANQDEKKRACFLAAVEAMDSEIGRLLNSLPASAHGHTTVIFVGDNGTPKPVTVAPFDPQHAKGSLFQGGINVPMIVSGSAVFNGGRDAYDLVNTTDLFATVAELGTGFALEELVPAGHSHDSISLFPILGDVPGSYRQYAYAEGFSDIGPGLSHKKAIRNQQFKLIREKNGTESLYDLTADPSETDPLPICAPGFDCQANPGDPCCDHEGVYAELTGELASMAATETACLIPTHCEDCPDCDRLDIFGFEQCDDSQFVPLSTCRRPHPDGESYVTCGAPGGTVQVDRCYCERLTLEARCFNQDSALSGLERSDGSGETCWSNTGL